MYYYILFGLVGLLVVWAIGSYLVIRNIEEPKYTVLEKRVGFEIRQYAPYLVAEATVEGDRDQALNAGFRIIADYIFGNNTAKTKIAMTAPVLDEAASEKISMTVPVIDAEADNNKRNISFVLPSKYTLDTLPTPNNAQVIIREVPVQKVAVLRYSWYGTNARIEKKTRELETLLKEANLTTTGSFRSAFYNPPLSMPLMLRNEIMVGIE